ncbi:MAG: GIY-YIG nuclease family protein [Pseudomonas sp.]|uniref:GIY-YIG nuclease family protein n=1 Tax=Pseudomonas sp. TaxID=306 RepID=UPI003D0E93DE
MAVYFIADRLNNLVKIGVSVDRDRRLRQLQTGNPFKLEFMGWIEEDEAHFVIEKKLHDKYSKKRFNGEWFKIGQEDVIHELKLYHGFIPKNDNAFEIVGHDKDGVPEYMGVWEWQEFELEECCPFCGCLCGMHYQDASSMYYCMSCNVLTNFDDKPDLDDF